MNLIDRDKLIKALEEEIRAGNEYLKDNPNEKCEELYLKGVRYALIVALSQPQVNQWIPCEERLPEYNELVIVCNIYGEIEMMRLFEDVEMHEDVWLNVFENPYYNIIAWQPLPKPYEEK